MPEWPKKAWEVAVDVAPYAEVIPADLGRELYEAIVASFERYPNPHPDAWQVVYPALARYEREVGE